MLAITIVSSTTFRDLCSPCLGFLLGGSELEVLQMQRIPLEYVCVTKPGAHYSDQSLQDRFLPVWSRHEDNYLYGLLHSGDTGPLLAAST